MRRSARCPGLRPAVAGRMQALESKTNAGPSIVMLRVCTIGLSPKRPRSRDAHAVAKPYWENHRCPIFSTCAWSTPNRFSMAAWTWQPWPAQAGYVDGATLGALLRQRAGCGVRDLRADLR